MLFLPPNQTSTELSIHFDTNTGISANSRQYSISFGLSTTRIIGDYLCLQQAKSEDL
jgi:hypothetical protein